MNHTNTSPTQRVLDALQECGCHVTPSGAGWSSRCPAHDDHSPSLSIAEGDDGRVLVHCHAGCSIDEIVRAIGVQKHELFVSDPFTCETSSVLARKMPEAVESDGWEQTQTESRSGSRSSSGAGWRAPKLYPSAQDAQAAVEAMVGSPVDAVWEYHGPQGDLVGLILRFELADGKTIRPVSLIEGGTGGGWILGGMPVRRPLYALREIIDSTGPVYVCEGEKACDAGRSCGLVTTTSPHGAHSASKADWSVLNGREVFILPDHDEAGEGYALDVVELAHEAGAASVRIVRLVDSWENLESGGDLADVMTIEGGDVEAVCDQLKVLVDLSDPVGGSAEEIGDQPNEETEESDEFVPFPVDVFPEPIRSYVIEGAAAIGCDSSFLALPMLSGLGAAIGNTHRIQLKTTWKEPPILWTAIVGESGTAKSPAIELALRFVRERQRNNMLAYREELVHWESDHAVWEAKQAKWKRDAASGKSTEALPEPARPVCERTWTDDATIEALVGKLMENPRGLLMVRDELAGWFSFDRYSGGKGGSEVARWLELFGGRELIIDRKGSGTEYVPSASVCIAGGIQPELLRKSLSDTNRENGLAARLLYAMPPRTQKRWSEQEISEQAEFMVSQVFDFLYGLEADISSSGSTGVGDPMPRIVKLSPDAKARWIRFVNNHGSEQMEMNGDHAAAWSKLEGYAARIALIIHLTRVASGDPGIDLLVLDRDSLETGICIMRWFARETNRVYAHLFHTQCGQSIEVRRKHSTLIKWVESKQYQTTVRELSRGPSGYRSKQKAQDGLDELAAVGLGKWKARPGGRTLVFHLHR